MARLPGRLTPAFVGSETPTKIDRVIDAVHAAHGALCRYAATGLRDVTGERIRFRWKRAGKENSGRTLNGKTLCTGRRARARTHTETHDRRLDWRDSSLRPELINSLASRLDKCLPAILIESVHGSPPWILPDGKSNALPGVDSAVDRRSGIGKHADSIPDKMARADPQDGNVTHSISACHAARCSIRAVWTHVWFMGARSLHSMNFAYWSIGERAVPVRRNMPRIAIQV